MDETLLEFLYLAIRSMIAFEDYYNAAISALCNNKVNCMPDFSKSFPMFTYEPVSFQYIAYGWHLWYEVMGVYRCFGEYHNEHKVGMETRIINHDEIVSIKLTLN